MNEEKTVKRFENQKLVKTEEEECHPLSMKSASKYVRPVWWDCIKELFSYEKEPSLYKSHKLFLDDRLKEGYKQYKNGDIQELVLTESDVRAEVASRTEDKTHTVVIKNWKGKPRKRYEIIRFLENLEVSCDGEDHQINGKYRSNSSLVCSHCSAVLWFLQQNQDMVKFLVSPEERKGGFKKSEPEEVKKKIFGYPLKKYRHWLNILELKEYKGRGPSLSLSIHRKNVEKDKELKPVWLTFTDNEEVKEIIEGLKEVYSDMLEYESEERELSEEKKEEEKKPAEKLKFHDFEETCITY